jgi:hypothetical protein
MLNIYNHPPFIERGTEIKSAKKGCHLRLSECVFQLICGFLLVFSCSRIATKGVLKRVTEALQDSQNQIKSLPSEL